MRFFLKVKQNGKQIGIKRIQAKQQLTKTDQLIGLIQKSISIQPINFIARLISDQNKFRIIAGWQLQHYNLRSGMQLEVQILSQVKKSMVQSMEDTAKSITENNSNGEVTKNQQIGQVLFTKKQMNKIIQEDEQEVQKSQQISHMVQTKYQQLLKYIQKNRTDMYFKQIKANNPQLGACENEHYKKQLLSIQNQLGMRGWAAIHCAIFSSNKQILNFLIEIGVDINNKTSDQWLPIQLAVRQQNLQMIDILIAQPLLNVNICTGHGLVLIMAVQSMNQNIVAKILEKDVNLHARDHLGRNVYDVIGNDTSSQIYRMLQMSQRRQSLTNVLAQKSVMYHALISSYRGQLLLIKTPPFKNKEYYLSLNPYQSYLKIYQQKSHYPQFPKQLVPLSLIIKFKELPKSERSWYMKSQLFYIIVATSKIKYIFGCHFENTMNRWINAYRACEEHSKKYEESIKNFQRNDTVIMDRVQVESKKKNSHNSTADSLMNLFTSKFSERSQESPQKMPTKELSSKSDKDKKQTKNDTLSQKREQVKQSNNPQTIKPKAVEIENAVQAPIKNGVKFEDFKILKTLGEGSFGTVFLALDLRNPQKKKLYALKCFKKKKLVINKQIKYTIAQLNILKQLSHPFIVNLHFTFQTPNYVYLGLDYCPNGDLSHHLMNEVTFPEKQAMIYAAEILLALEYLHEKNIIYRDLKPQNIMLDDKGHVRLVDFGLSKQGSDREFVAKSFCGSPAYLSPEMLIKKGVGKQSDFYCLGAVLYQMLVGQPPFFSDDITTLYQNITNSKLTFPKSLSNESKSLLTGLLERDPHKRLGYKGAHEIRQHNFFKQINWQNLLKRAVKAPVRQEAEAEPDDNLLTVQSNHKDFDYTPDNFKINRFLNFSFMRDEANND